MTTSGSSETAKIYTFPARGRFAANGQREEFAQPANVQIPQASRLRRQRLVSRRSNPSRAAPQELERSAAFLRQIVKASRCKTHGYLQPE